MDIFIIIVRKGGKLNATGITQDIRHITITKQEETEMDVTETLQTVTSGVYVYLCRLNVYNMYFN